MFLPYASEEYACQIWKMQLLYNEAGSNTHLSPLSLKWAHENKVYS